jgi:EmrB/QacA subfamily drug resistance transporter
VSAAPRRALLVTSVASLLVALDSLAVTTALPAIAPGEEALGARAWVVNAYTLAVAAGIVPATALGDRLGRRRAFTAGLALFTAASACCALAPGTGALLAARALQGLGAASVAPLGLAILTAAYPDGRRGTALGLWGGAGGLGVAAGPLLGAALTQALGWHWIFWANLPVGLAALALCGGLPDPRGGPARPDWRGVVTLTGAAGAGMEGLTLAAGPGWTARGTLAALAGALLLLAAFGTTQRRCARPLVPRRVLRAPGVLAGTATWVLMTATISAATFLVAQFFQEARGDQPLAAGAHLLPWTVAPLLVAPWAGALADRVGCRPVLAAGMLAQGVGLAWFAAAAGPTVPYARLAGPLLLAGLGIAAAMPVAVGAALGGLPPEDLGVATGAASTVQRLGGGAGVAVSAAVFAACGSLAGPAGYTAGFRPALAAAAALSMAGVLTALRVGRPVGAAAVAAP